MNNFSTSDQSNAENAFIDVNKSNNDIKLKLQNPEAIPMNQLATNFTGNLTPSKATIQQNKIQKDENQRKIDIPQIKISLKDITNKFQTPNLSKDSTPKNGPKVSSTGMKGNLKGDSGLGYILQG